MKIFVIGDYRSGTGPANATKSLIDALGDVEVQKHTNKLQRLMELYAKIPKCDVCLLSGHSKQNLHALRIAKKHGKPVFFWMHGCVEHENAINKVPNEDMNLVERAVLAGSDKILAVSEKFADWLKENDPECRDRIAVLPNGIDSVSTSAAPVDDPARNRNLVSVGGGMIRKRIVKICEAIEILNREAMGLKLHVFGAFGGDSRAIEAYPFVKDHGVLEQGLVRSFMERSALYIQNSCFETFGLAPLEALDCGCSLLLSKELGALEVFDRGVIGETDLILNCEDPAEIAEKIKGILESPNHDRLSSGINRRAHSWGATAEKLRELCEHEIY